MRAPPHGLPGTGAGGLGWPEAFARSSAILVSFFRSVEHWGHAWGPFGTLLPLAGVWNIGLSAECCGTGWMSTSPWLTGDVAIIVEIEEAALLALSL